MLDDKLKLNVPTNLFTMITAHEFSKQLCKSNIEFFEFQLQESGAVVRIDNKKVTVLSKSQYSDDDTDTDDEDENKIEEKKKRIPEILANFEYESFFTCGICGGNIINLGGELILVATSEKEFISISGGYGGPYIDKIVLKNAIANTLQYCYTICSGGDPGSMYAMNKDYMYLFGLRRDENNRTRDEHTNVLHIKRNKYVETAYCKKNKIKKNFPVLADMYLSIEMGPNRCFGYNEMKDINEADILQLLLKNIPEDVFPNISSYLILNNELKQNIFRDMFLESESETNSEI